MRVTIVAVGRQRAGPLRDLERHFAERITFPLVIREVEERRKLSPAELKAREAKLLLDAVPKGSVLVALDGRGTQLASADFAKRLDGWRQSNAELAFIVGGAEGLHESVIKTASFALSLGAMTWPHLLARGMLLEQIYRAQQILAGHPYHRE